MHPRPARRGGMLLLLAASPVVAQFAQLTATDDGTQLYFTSQLTLRGSTPATPPANYPEARLFRFGPDGVTLFAERGSLASPNVSGSGAGVANPQVSGDGQTIGFTFTIVCPANPCVTTIDEAQLRGRQTLDLGPGRLRMSHNGRWAILTGNTNSSTPGERSTYPSTLIDLTTGQRTDLPPALDPNGWTLASDGTVLLRFSTGPWGIWKQGQFTPVTLPADFFYSLELSDDAATIIATTFRRITITPSFQVTSIDIASGNVTTLLPTGTLIRMGASTNGQLILYRDNYHDNRLGVNGPAWFADFLSGQITPIDLPAGEFVTDGTLNGPGDTAFLVTTQGRIIKVARATGAITTLFPATPYCDLTRPVAAGSRTSLTCNVSALEGQIVIDGRPAPVIDASSGQIDIQIPWEARSEFNLFMPNDSPFDSTQNITVFTVYPHFLSGLAMIKGDWSGLLDTQPGPGEIVHLYMTGLGPVRTPEQTGVPASLTTPNPIAGDFTCRFHPQQQDAQTLFAGLAPGLLGIYQVSMRMPDDAGQSPINGISCTIQSAGGGGSFGVYSPANPIPASRI